MCLIIMNAEDLRRAYEILEVMSEANVQKSYIIDLKRSIRKCPYLLSKKDTRIIKDYGIDGYLELIELPSDLELLEDATDYFLYRYYIPPVNSIFDCTGERFTLSYKIFKRRNAFYVFHDVRFDV